ncbi:ABC transporter permease [Saccharopolyspora dendranthemae]|uniref:Transport permease protein n=1 Tax=Saccharopolyspora dendranthemae TaxID=1181886 RepID=A0A561U9C8_9PSEU|nr:ABC transporter permease [Saccharopolyspora dendranthemae]TWF95971.1 ABC-2 type transport system permease protein [Saccharopolyspora dendranthemae]
MTTTLTAPPSAPAPAPTTRRWRGASYPTQILVLTGRSLRAVIKDPRVVIFSLLQPLIMLTLFSQVFGKAMMGNVADQGGSYINYLMPAILVTTGIGAAMQSGVGLVTDMKNGVIARFRALPIGMSAVLIARSLADLARTAVQLIVLLTVAALVYGFAPAGGFGGTLGAFFLALFVSWSLSWLFLALGSWLRKEEVMQSIGFLAMFPLMFASSAFVPVQSLPTWLGVVAKINPLTYAVDASRNLSLALPTGAGVISALATSALLCAVGITIAVRGFRRPL